MLIAQLSDPHVTVPGVLSNGFVDTVAALRRAVAHVLGLAPRPDLVLLTGDLVDSVEPAGYRTLCDALAPLPIPLYAIPGNHDDRGLLRTAFVADGYLPVSGEFLHYALESYPLRLIGLDTHVPGAVGGALCPARLDWLAARLAEAPERPTLIFMHHPPFATGLPADRYGFPGAEALGALLERHRQVRRLVCGHVHRAVHSLWHGVHASTCPSTAHQIALELGGGPGGVPGSAPGSAPGGVPGGVPGAAPRSHIVLEPPALHLHTWRPETGFVTHLSPIGDYPVRDFAAE